MRMQHIRAMARKEWWHLFRDPRSLALILLMPTMLLFLFGYAIRLDITEAPVGILQESRDAISDDLGMTAQPLTVIKKKQGVSTYDQILELYHSWKDCSTEVARDLRRPLLLAPVPLPVQHRELPEPVLFYPEGLQPLF